MEIEKKPKGPSEKYTLSKTLDFLRTMVMTGSALTVSEMTELMGVTKPTAYSVINTLVSHGYLEKAGDGKSYRVGYSFYIYGHYYPRNYPFLVYAEKYVLELFNALHFRVNVCVYKPPMTALVIASKDESLLPRRVNGYTLPTYASASGKLFLANLPPELMRKTVEEADIQPLTPLTITDKNELISHLEQIYAAGWADDIGEYAYNQVCAAAPVFDSTGAMVCTISIAHCPISHYEANRDEIVGIVRNTANQLSLDLGYCPDIPRKPVAYDF